MRPVREPDANALFRMFSDPRVARYLSRPAWSTVDQAHEYIAKDVQALASGKYLRLGIERTEDGELIGECSLFNLAEQCRRAELGYAMGFSAWGHGYMHEALTALLEFGFAHLALNRVEAEIDPRNEGSAKSLKRLGFLSEGHLRERWIVEGEVSDSGLYGLLLRDWSSGKQSAAKNKT